MKRALAALVAVAWAGPFGFLQPTAELTDKELRRLAAGEVIVRTVRGRPREITLVSAVKIGVDGPRVTSWYRNISELRASPFVPEIGRFSNPPRIEDLARLTIESVDVDELERCRPNNCGIKLQPSEITEMQRAFMEPSASQRATIQAAFRRVVLGRVLAFLKNGRADGPPPPVFFSTHFPQLAVAIQQYPQVSAPGTESFLYWAKEKLSSGKPIVSATHVTIATTGSSSTPLVVVSRQLFATHYEDGAWGVTTLVHDERGVKYLVYVNQTEVDLLGGIFGGMVRSTIERRLRGQAEELMQGVRRRMESGEPRGVASAK